MAESIPLKTSDPKTLIQDGEFTYFLASPDDPAPMGQRKSPAEVYFETRYPNSKALFVTQLTIARLSDRHTVITLIRGDGRTAPDSYKFDEHARNLYRENRVGHDAMLAMAGEVIEGEPIVVAKYWIKGRGRGDEGHLNEPAFISALGEQAIPCYLRRTSELHAIYPAY